MKRIGRGFIIFWFPCHVGHDGLGRACYLLFQPVRRRTSQAFGHCLRHFWRGGATLVPFLGQTKSSFVGFCRGFSAARCLVVDDSS